MTDEAKQGIFGIDLGTTYSAVAYIDDAGKPVIARNGAGEETTPSVIFFESESNVVVGTVAKESAVTMPDSVVSLVKREMGNKDYRREFFGETYSSPSLSALILKALALSAEAGTGRKLEQAVITVPAYFGMLEKSATRQAGEIAGIDVIGVIEEPVAAAIAYGFGKETESKTILVYDLGGGTFDVTIIRLGTEEIRVLAVDGNRKLGGADWDSDLMAHIIEEVVEQLGDDSIRDDEYAIQEIALKTEKTKRHLSEKEADRVAIRHGGGSATVNVTRAEFEEITRPRLDLTIEVTRRALETLDEKHPGAREEISDVLLVGGSSKMPAVAARLKSEFGWEPKLADPDLAVAKGAALYAAGQWGKIVPVDPDRSEESAEGEGAATFRPAETEEEEKEALVRAADETGIAEADLRLYGKRTVVGALPKAIGVKMIDTKVDGWQTMNPPPFYIYHLVDAQAEVPIKDPLRFPAAVAEGGADVIPVEVWEQAGEVAGRELHENTFLDDGEITGLREFNLPAEAEVELLFTVDEDGVAVVEAREPKSGKAVAVTVTIKLLDAEAMENAKRVTSNLTAMT